jgi:hypothetical protein
MDLEDDDLLFLAYQHNLTALTHSLTSHTLFQQQIQQYMDLECKIKDDDP